MRKRPAWSKGVTMQTRIWLAPFAVLIALGMQPLSAQTQTRLTGTVTDDTGGAIPGAQITISNINTGVTQTAETNASGSYNFPFVAAGQYELICEFEGFKTHSRSGIVLETGTVRGVDIQMQVGDVTETIEVAAAAPLLETESSTVGQFIERDTVFNMPLASRRSASLVRLLGNVTYRNEGGAEALPFFSMAGGRSRNQMWTLDGTVIQNMSLGIAQLGLNPPAESLQEFKVEQSNYSAEYGRAGGGFIVMTTRSGTNDFHGAVYEFFRNQAIDTRTFFARDKAPLRYNIFGASASGPIAKNKTFYFANYEGGRRRDGVTYSSDDVPHPIELQGDFSNRAGLALQNPYGAEGELFPNNTIPPIMIDPLARALTALYPAPNVASDITQAPANNFVNNASNALTQDFVTAKVDHHFSSTDSASWRFQDSRNPQTSAAVYPNDFADPRAATRHNHHTNITGSWIHHFSPTLIQEVRVNWGRRLHINRSAGRNSGKNGELGIPGVNPEAFARIGVNGLTNLGAGNHERIQTPIETWQFVDTYTWIAGDHQVRFGGEWRFAMNVDDFNQSTGGRFNFGNRATGVGLAELLLGHVSSGQLVDADILETRTDYYGFFIQDDWKVTPSFTMNLGLRWELDTPRWERLDNRQSGFDPNEINPVCNCPGVVTFSGRDGRSKYAHDFDANNLGPRFGFAWEAARGFVVRGGYGINYNGMYARAVPFTLFNGFSLNGSFTSPDGGLTRAFKLEDGMPEVVKEPLTPAFGAVAIGERPRLAPDFFQWNQHNGMHQQWNLGLQKELPGNLLAEISYIGNVGHNLGGANVNINQVPLVNGRGPDQQSQSARRFPQFNNVFHESPPWGNSAYHSMNLKAEKRYSGGMNFLVNYTWSKFMDDVEAATELGGEVGNGYTHVELRHLDKSLSGNDVRQRFIGSIVYELPFGKGRPISLANSALDAVVGGWGIGLISEFRSGVPFGVVENRNLSNTFNHAQRPNLLSSLSVLSNWRDNVRANDYFDPNIFEAPGPGGIGTSPRNLCCGPGFNGFDLSVHKWFDFTEKHRLQLRGDFYNLFNRAVFANPELRRGRGQFGRISSVLVGSSGRLAQVSLRMEF